MKNYFSEIVKTGLAFSDALGYVSVKILKQNWDFYYDEGYDDEAPDLNEQGIAYYVIYGAYDDISYANRSRTCLSESEAIQFAEQSLHTKINWEQ